MKEKIIKYVERLNNKQVVLGLSGLVMIPILVILGSSFAYGRFISPVIKEKSTVDLEPLPGTTKIPIMPVQPVTGQSQVLAAQENYVPVLLSNDPIALGPEIGGGRDNLGGSDAQPSQPLLSDGSVALDPEIGGGRNDLGESVVQPTQTGVVIQPTPPTQPVPGNQGGWPLPSEAKDSTSAVLPSGTDRGVISIQDVNTKVLDVPGYICYNGCGPTAAGMVLGYWDNMGYGNIVSGSAMTQTAAVNAMISSTENYNDYCLPLDDATTGWVIQADKSELPVGDEHVDNSIADYMKTSQSVYWNNYGYTRFDRIADGLNGWVQQTGVGTSTTQSLSKVTDWNGSYALSSDELTWEVYKGEIDAGRPMVLLVDTNGDNGTDRYVTGIGYSEPTGQKLYIVRDGMDTGEHSYPFAKMDINREWGIYGAVLFQLTGTVSGTVKDDLGVALAGVTVTTNTGISATTNASGVYTLSGLTAGAYTITPVLAGYGFTPANRTVIVPPSTTTQDFTGIKGAISGTIKDTTGVALAGVTVSTNTGVTAVTDASGVYSFSGLTAGAYTITPALAGYSFTPINRVVTVPTSATAQDFTGTKCTQLVTNGDFETNTGWTLPVTVYPANYDSSVTLDVTAQYSMEMVHSGTRSVRSGIIDATKNVYSYSSAWQQVTIPAGVKSATLNFWLYPLSVGAVEGSGGDLQLMLILDSNKVEKERLVMIRSDERVWKSYVFDLTKYAGQSIWIYFGVYNNGWGSNMAMYVDDVSLAACNP